MCAVLAFAGRRICRDALERRQHGISLLIARLDV